MKIRRILLHELKIKARGNGSQYQPNIMIMKLSMSRTLVLKGFFTET